MCKLLKYQDANTNIQAYVDVEKRTVWVDRIADAKGVIQILHGRVVVVGFLGYALDYPKDQWYLKPVPKPVPPLTEEQE
ncbi:hypothetical protein N9933_03725, partial [bacterium]|nr:hypothetical protein [bacterium]